MLTPVYSRLGALLGPDGALYAYSDDVYMLADPGNMAVALSTAPAIYKKVGLRIGWGPGKTELTLPPTVAPETFLYLLPEGCYPSVVLGFSACLGVPRHPLNDPDFISTSLGHLGERHDRLLDLIEEIASEDPFAGLRLLQVCGVNRFGRIISVVPPSLVLPFATSRDEAVASTFDCIQQAAPSELSTHSLPVGDGGASITSLAKHVAGSYLGAFFRVVGPLHQRLIAMGGATNRLVAAHLTQPFETSASAPWASFVCAAHSAALSLQQFFTNADQLSADQSIRHAESHGNPRREPAQGFQQFRH